MTGYRSITLHMDIMFARFEAVHHNSISVIQLFTKLEASRIKIRQKANKTFNKILKSIEKRYLVALRNTFQIICYLSKLIHILGNHRNEKNASLYPQICFKIS